MFIGLFADPFLKILPMCRVAWMELVGSYFYRDVLGHHASLSTFPGFARTHVFIRDVEKWSKEQYNMLGLVRV